MPRCLIIRPNKFWLPLNFELDSVLIKDRESVDPHNQLDVETHPKVDLLPIPLQEVRWEKSLNVSILLLARKTHENRRETKLTG